MSGHRARILYGRTVVAIFILTFTILDVALNKAIADTIFADPNRIISILQGEGYKAKLSKDRDGDPKIESSSRSLNWEIYFYGCKNGVDCESIQFYAGFQSKGRVSLAKVNEWNNKRLFTKAKLDKDYDVELSREVSLVGGVSEKNFVNVLESWDRQVGDFVSFIDW